MQCTLWRVALKCHYVSLPVLWVLWRRYSPLWFFKIRIKLTAHPMSFFGIVADKCIKSMVNLLAYKCKLIEIKKTTAWFYLVVKRKRKRKRSDSPNDKSPNTTGIEEKGRQQRECHHYISFLVDFIFIISISAWLKYSFPKSVNQPQNNFVEPKVE